MKLKLILFLTFCCNTILAEEASVVRLKCVNETGTISIESLFLLEAQQATSNLIVQGRQVALKKVNIILSSESEAGATMQQPCDTRTVEFSFDGPSQILVCGPGSKVNLEPVENIRMVPTGKWYYDYFEVHPKLGIFNSCDGFAELQ